MEEVPFISDLFEMLDDKQLTMIALSDWTQLQKICIMVTLDLQLREETQLITTHLAS